MAATKAVARGRWIRERPTCAFDFDFRGLSHIVDWDCDPLDVARQALDCTFLPGRPAAAGVRAATHIRHSIGGEAAGEA